MRSAAGKKGQDIKYEIKQLGLYVSFLDKLR
jgi:hypothetical protein